MIEPLHTFKTYFFGGLLRILYSMLVVLFSSTLFHYCATLVYDVLYFFYDNSILFYIILWKKTLQEKAQFLYPA